MRSILKRSELILILVLGCIALLGIGYSSWNQSGILFASVTTGHMDYQFNSGHINIVHKNGMKETVPAEIKIESGKSLEINIKDAADFLSKISIDDSMLVEYTVSGTSKDNVTLKDIDKDIGKYSFSLDKNTVKCSYNGNDIPANKAISLLPPSIGNFQVYHTFDGTNGSFKFKPLDLPDLTSMVNHKELSDDLITAMNIKTEKDSISPVPEIVMSASDIKDSKREENNISATTDKAAKEIKKKKVKIGDLSISANYNISIPLDYDQYNAQ